MFLVDKIDLHESLEQIKVKTILSAMSYNIFAILRSYVISTDSSPKPTYTFPLSDVQFSEKDDPDSKVLRLMMGDLKFFCHRNRSQYDPELF